jgi:hypothetical protein
VRVALIWILRKEDEKWVELSQVKFGVKSV